MPTIGVIANSTWNIFNFRISLIRELEKEGYTVVAIAPEDEYTPKLKNLDIRFVPIKNLSRKGQNPIKDIQLIFEIRNIILREKIDILLSYTIKPNIYGSLATYFTPSRNISNVTGLGYSFLNKGISYWVSKRLYKISFKKSYKVVFQNSDDKLLFEKLKIVSTDKLTIINGSGINTVFFSPKESDKLKEHFNFIFIGRLLIDKGILDFFEASQLVLKQFPSAKFVVIGSLDLENRATIEKETLELWLQNPNCTYLGSSNKIREVIAQTDVVVLPSYREGLPRVMLEALSMGKPVITTDTAGCRETVIDGHNGYLVQVKNAQDLADKMEKMLKHNEDELKLMGENGRKMALEKFDSRIINRKYVSLIESLAVSDLNTIKPCSLT